MNRKARRTAAAISRRRERRGQREQGMSEQNQQGQVPAQFQAFVQRVAQLGAEHGLQAVVVAGAVPGAGGHGPSTVHALAWVHGQPGAEWRTAAAGSLAQVAVQAAASMAPAQQAVSAAAETESAAPAEGGDAPEVKPDDAAPAAA